MTQWHRLLDRLLEELLEPVGVSVYTDFPVMSNPPEADILLLRRDTRGWSPSQQERLPDEVNESEASHILLEFKYTESISEASFRQALGYDTFYRRAKHLPAKDVQTFLISAKSPRNEVWEIFDYTLANHPGVYTSTNVLLSAIPLLSLNDLADKPNNAYIKCFASRKRVKRAAFALLIRKIHSCTARFNWWLNE